MWMKNCPGRGIKMAEKELGYRERNLEEVLDISLGILQWLRGFQRPNSGTTDSMARVCDALALILLRSSSTIMLRDVQRYKEERKNHDTHLSG